MIQIAFTVSKAGTVLVGIIGRENNDVRISGDARILEVHMVQLFLLYINPVAFSS